jgi:hypothetical protein
VERSIKCQLPDSTPIILCIGILKRRESECGTVPSGTGTAHVPFSLPTYVCTVVPIFLNILFFVQAPTFLVTFLLASFNQILKRNNWKKIYLFNGTVARDLCTFFSSNGSIWHPWGRQQV